MDRVARHIAAAAALLASAASAQLPQITLTPVFQTAGTNKLAYPVAMGEIPGKPGHFWAAEQGLFADSARIRVLAPGSGGHVKSTLLGLKVKSGVEEMGLLSVAFHPKYAENRKYYVYFTEPKDGTLDSNVLEERIADASLLADSKTPPRRLLSFGKSSAFHNGGTVVFGKDGYLYITLGEDHDPANAQSLKSFLGGVLRIDVDKQEGGKPYGIPADNPFVGNTDAGVVKERWAYGLRNPFRASIDPLTGDLWVGDVGDTRIEEVNRIKKGGNYGWGEYEGELCNVSSCSSAGKEPPTASITRANGQAMVGGVVYRGNSGSPFYGAYFFGDYRLRTVSALTLAAGGSATVQVLATASSNVAGFASDSEGNVYAVLHGTGVIVLLDHPQLKPGPVSSRLQRSRAVTAYSHCRISASLCFYRGGREYQTDGRRFPALPGRTAIRK